MTSNDKLADKLIEHSVNFDRMSNTLAREVVQELEKLERELLLSLVNKKLTRYQRTRIEAFLSQTAKTIAENFDRISSDFQDNFYQIADLEKKAVRNAINAAVSIAMPIGIVASVSSVIISEKVLEKVVGNNLIDGSPAKNWWKLKGQKAAFDFAGAVRSGILQGETGPQIASRIVDLGGIVSGPRAKKDALSLALTSIQTVAQSARMAAYEDDVDLIKGYQWLSILDARTTHQCKALSGLTWGVDKEPQGHSKPFRRPPIHWRCRSTIVPVLKSWEELSGKKLPGVKKDIDDAFRARLIQDPAFKDKADSIMRKSQSSMDGQVAASHTYESWLKTKPKDFQEKVLGQGRYDLWKAGKIDMRDLVDNSQNPLTLKQLQGLVG